jgi:outer membrane protein assembly factor BamE
MFVNNNIKFIIFFSILASLAGCSIHRMDIQQGNVLTEETLNRLVVGMDKRKVRGIAGTPLIQDPFRTDRWDYVYTFLHGITREKQYSYVTLLFQDNVLVDIKVHAEPLRQDEINSLNRQLRRGHS